MRSDASIATPEWAAGLGLHGAEATAPDGTTLRFWVGGAASGPRVLMLHGFPQNAGAWQKVAARVVPSMRVVIPDLRGYGESDLAASGRYDLDTLVADVATIEGATRREGEPPGRALLLAHDWGGPVAWHVLHTRPELVRGLVATNAPHFLAYARELTTPDQAKRSWYTALFQIPYVERLLCLGDGKAFRFALGGSATTPVFTPDEIDSFVRPLLRPGRARAALQYYREGAGYLRRHRDLVRDMPKTAVPAIIVWGQNDVALAPSHPDACRRYVTNLEIRRLDGVTHWVPEQAPDEVARAVHDLAERTA